MPWTAATPMGCQSGCHLVGKAQSGAGYDGGGRWWLWSTDCSISTRVIRIHSGTAAAAAAAHAAAAHAAAAVYNKVRRGIENLRLAPQVVHCVTYCMSLG